MIGVKSQWGHQSCFTVIDIEIWGTIRGEGRRTCWSGGCFLQFRSTGSPPLSSLSLPLTGSQHFSGPGRVFSDSWAVNRVPRWCRGQWTPVLHAAWRCWTWSEAGCGRMWTDVSWLRMTVRLHFYVFIFGLAFYSKPGYPSHTKHEPSIRTFMDCGKLCTRVKWALRKKDVYDIRRWWR